MSRLLDFYRGNGLDSEGRSLEEILSWSDDELESVHDFIQWLFPLPEPSHFNPGAPLLSEADIAAFKNDPVLRANLLKCFERILDFLGFSMTADGKVLEGDNFPARVSEVWAVPNHNWLRITRILRCLTLAGMEPQARNLYDRLVELHTSSRFPIPSSTFGYWTSAIETS